MPGPHPRARALRSSYVLSTLYLLVPCAILGVALGSIRVVAVGFSIAGTGILAAAIYCDAGRLLPRGVPLEPRERRTLRRMLIGMIGACVTSLADAGPRGMVATAIAVVLVVGCAVAISVAVYMLVRQPQPTQAASGESVASAAGRWSGATGGGRQRARHSALKVVLALGGGAFVLGGSAALLGMGGASDAADGLAAAGGMVLSIGGAVWGWRMVRGHDRSQ